jgi:asparagine synthase (glutamine-hydrolysing)
MGRASIPRPRLQKTMQLMRRRGPDHAACEELRCGKTQVLLLHSRLSIIDLDPRANQPFWEGDQGLICNGELYNYLELRERLGERGHRFVTSSDTEVLLKVLAEFGWEGLDLCEGMWAFAWYNRATGRLVLARDRFGEKPLYLHRDESGLYFGSEVKFIAALLGKRLPLNRRHLCRYLVNGYKALYKGNEQFFAGLEELPPATALLLDPAGERRVNYWRPQAAEDEGMGYEEAVAGVRERLLRAVELRLRADVPLAFCMSGGVDSNALIGIAKRHCGYDVHGFTVANADARYEERAAVEGAVAELGIRHSALPLETRDFLPRLRALVVQHDAPVFTISYYAHWLLMEQIAGQGYRISVSGTGADELFTGYYDHHLAYLYEVRDEPELHAPALRAWREHIQPLVRNPYLGDPGLFLADPASRGHIFLNAAEFSQYLVEPWSEPFAEERYSASLLRNRMLNELRHEAVPVILHEDDLNAMYFSVENRSPFLDRHLFEFCYRIPSRLLMRDAFTKIVLRDAVRGLAPEAALNSRRKVGFNAPILDFLDLKNPEVRAALLEPGPVFDLVRRERIWRLLEREALPNSESKLLFYFLNAKFFLEEFGV